MEITANTVWNSKISVKDRNYDSNYKTESVTVEVRAENADSAYEVAYAVVGSRQNGDWDVTSVQEMNTTVLPKESLSQGIVDSDVAQLLQEKENASVPRGTFCGKGLLKPPKLCYTKTQRCKQKKLPLKS